MDVANFITAAVDTADERIRGTCMVILEETDPGTFDRGAATRKLVHQLSSTRDPIFSLKVPASRIVGGYTVKDGVIIPNYNHSEIIDAVFKRTRVTVGLMTAAKLLSAIEPIVRYHRGRFRGGDKGSPGSPRHELGLQQREDVLHRLVEVWATGEASASLGFAASRHFDDLEAVEEAKDAYFAEKGISGVRRQMREAQKAQPLAVEYIQLSHARPDDRDDARLAELEKNPLVRFLVEDAVGSVLCPAGKLWNTGHGANMMREAVSLMGGYGITEDCPGFLGQKWMDAQLEATYEGPEAVQRRQLSVTMTSDVFLAHFQAWIAEMRDIAARYPTSGACALGSAMELWMWTLQHLLESTDADGKPLYRDRRQGVTFPMTDALAWLLASRYQILDTLELMEKAPQSPTLSEAAPGLTRFFADLCHVQSARAAGETARICAELVFGYNRHPDWQGGCETCFRAEELQDLESIMAGIEATAPGVSDVIETDGSHPKKAGPCVSFVGLDGFIRRRRKLDGCVTGARLSKDRAAYALTQVMIPEALDYPT
jgi:alkylation response protein AidB-like acyl-CoA dehydrogenase